MEHLFAFIVRHWALVGLFILALIWFLIEEMLHQNGGGLGQTPLAVTQMINKQNALVIDVRSKSAFDQGHISGSVQVDMADLNKDHPALVSSGERPIIVVCALGHRASRAVSQLKKDGFTTVYLLRGGIAAWKKEQMPLKKTGGI